MSRVHVLTRASRNLRVLLIALEGVEYWYESREDQILAAERRALLPY